MIVRMKSMRKWLFGLLCLTCLCGQAQMTDYKCYEGKFNFFVVNDMGRNGYYHQKDVAATMGRMAAHIDPEFVMALGDVHHFYGVASTSDPLWMTNYELIYDRPELMIPWYAVLGNHEYRGNTQAVLDYGRVSRRWMMPGRYYTKVFAVDDSTAVRVVWLDTTPLIDSYRADRLKYPDAWKQDRERELAWTDSVLTAAKEKWVIVGGHHPLYAATGKSERERKDMQERLGTILRRHHVDAYLCGHIHNFQYIRMSGDGTEYVVNTAGAQTRPAGRTTGTVFCSSAPGFMVCSVTGRTLELRLVDMNGKVLYTVKR
jgi:3',5'-cyclic AMP phosphodiesterase CpdA